MKEVICLSGGFDSSITAAILADTARVLPLFFDYEQPACIEEHAAAVQVAHLLGLTLETIRLPQLAKGRDLRARQLSPFYVPHRNLIFAAVALNYAEQVDASTVHFGFVADTIQRNFPDATTPFVESINALLQVTDGASRIRAQNIHLRKRELVELAYRRRFPAQLTYSCYFGGGRCHTCPSCIAVKTAFSDAAVDKPPEIVAVLKELNPYEQRPDLSRLGDRA